MKNILIIDDESQIRKLMGKQLERAGYAVLEAANGVEGCEMFRKNDVDLVITDLTMPEKNGIETIKDIVAETPNARIIAMSGGGQRFPDYFLEKASAEGALLMLKKPIRNEELLTAVSKALA